MRHVQSVDASAGGAFLVVPGNNGLLAGAKLAAAAADATAVIRENDGSGRILAKLAAKAGEADELRPMGPIHYTTQVHVTMTGAAAQLNLFQA